jgi:hypothetical protein
MMSGTSARVGDHYAANTIGMQMASTGFGTVVIPTLMGMLARQVSLEVIPVSLFLVYAGLFGFYILAAMNPMAKTMSVPARADVEVVE